MHCLTYFSWSQHCGECMVSNASLSDHNYWPRSLSMSLITFISVLADARVRIGLLQPHVDVVDVRHRQVEQRGGDEAKYLQFVHLVFFIWSPGVLDNIG